MHRSRRSWRFLSVLSCSLLNQAVGEEHLWDPAQILDFLRFQIYKTFRNSNEIKDGMDLSICCLEKISTCYTQVLFAGSKSRLYTVQDGNVEFLKSDRLSIGGDDYCYGNYQNQQLKITNSDCLYLCTDGIFDICNPNRQRFGYSRFEQFIAKHWQEPMKQQKKILLETIQNFQADQDQRDDITILGVKL